MRKLTLRTSRILVLIENILETKKGMGWVKTTALVMLVAQNASLVLTMRSSRTQSGEKYSNTAAVFIMECLKGTQNIHYYSATMLAKHMARN